jgi:hypothetical protein
MTRDPWSGAWLGVALIAMGLLFLIQNYLGYELRNWWALFILIPAVGAFTSAWNSWRSGDDAVAAAGAFTMGVIFTAVTLVFLLDLPWARIWPVFIIIAGLGLLIPGRLRRRDRDPLSGESDIARPQPPDR